MSKRNQPSHQSVAVVTGAGSGIGRSFALALAARGGRVLCADIRPDDAEATASLIRASGAHAVAMACDVGDAEQMRVLSEQADALLGAPVSLVINNAGVGLGGKIGDITLEDWRWCMNVNLWGVIHGCHYFAPRLQAQGYGGIINVASAAGFGAAPEMSAYNVTKAGVMSLSETLAAELAPAGIKVNVLCPTLVPTNIIANGRVPAHMNGFASKAIKDYAMTTSDAVARLTLDRLDRGHLYTLPQIDAKLVWLLKRLAPATYARGLGAAYRWMPT